MASNWDTIDIFVTSYSRDFTKEREIIAKHVLPDFEAWAETKRIQINVTEVKWVRQGHVCSWEGAWMRRGMTKGAWD